MSCFCSTGFDKRSVKDGWNQRPNCEWSHQQTASQGQGTEGKATQWSVRQQTCGLFDQDEQKNNNNNNKKGNTEKKEICLMITNLQVVWARPKTPERNERKVSVSDTTAVWLNKNAILIIVFWTQDLQDADGRVILELNQRVQNLQAELNQKDYKLQVGCVWVLSMVVASVKQQGQPVVLVVSPALAAQMRPYADSDAKHWGNGVLIKCLLGPCFTLGLHRLYERGLIFSLVHTA